MTDVILESKSVGNLVAFTFVAAIEVQAIMERVLNLLGVHSGHYLHMFSTLYFTKNRSAMNMFASNKRHLMFQLQWLEKQYEKRYDLW